MTWILEKHTDIDDLVVVVVPLTLTYFTMIRETNEVSLRGTLVAELRTEFEASGTTSIAF